MISLINLKTFNSLTPQESVNVLQDLTQVLKRKEVLDLAKSITARVKKLDKANQDKFVKFIYDKNVGRESIDSLAMAFKMSGKSSEKEWKQWLTEIYGDDLNPNDPNLSFKQIKKKESDSGIRRLFFND